MSGINKCVLLTGGAGYIGSHCLVEILNSGYDAIVVDNFSNSVPGKETAPSLDRVEIITRKKITLYKCDLQDSSELEKIFKKYRIDCVIHMAGAKAVGESMQLPLMYYKYNVASTITLLEVMDKFACHNLIFSSSFCVYGTPQFLPITESHPTGNVTNVYGRTKYFVEEILQDLSRSDPKWNIIILRYFNPAGAHFSGLIGEAPTKEIFNLMPFIAEVALGNKAKATIFGNDFDTIDGTGTRDYVHVMDLAAAHVAALKNLFSSRSTCKVYNLGSGIGISTLELIKTFERVTNRSVPFDIKGRREGDIPSIIADTTLARTELGWEAKYDIVQMCTDFWLWKSRNPHGYSSNSDEEKIDIIHS